YEVTVVRASQLVECKKDLVMIPTLHVNKVGDVALVVFEIIKSNNMCVYHCLLCVECKTKGPIILTICDDHKNNNLGCKPPKVPADTSDWKPDTTRETHRVDLEDLE
ncbi:hypothetical protein LY78DRAFT_586367, partial [Colletotrichum sublineola]